MYFVRRAFATLLEMDNAFRRLNQLPEFKARKKTFDRRRLKTWVAAFRFFTHTKDFINRQRNAYGGHFHDDAARHVLSQVDHNDDSPGTLELKFSGDHSLHLVFGFAEDIVITALFVDRGERDREEFLHESFEILMDAVKHAGHATQILADEYILPVFGWRP